MEIVYCYGNAHEIGLQHGRTAKRQILRSIRFYQGLFQTKCGMDWPSVKKFALQYQPYLAQEWPLYVSEMEGVADGADVGYLDILALNVRTEIAFGKFSDACTAVSWTGGSQSLLAQNWDWYAAQAGSLIILKIAKERGGMCMQMVTEAGIIGKIGLNEKGVGCTLNAIKAAGVSYTRLPVHLALRTVLESKSKDEAVAALEKAGVASACHILVADITGSVGLECSARDVVRVPMDERGVVTHTNHYIAAHAPEVEEAKGWVPDTEFRLERMNELVAAAVQGPGMSAERVQEMLKDKTAREDGVAICRGEVEGTAEKIVTLFGIVMDLASKKATVLEGRPSEPTEEFVLDP
ncbi:AAT-domain-containing protein [Coleophoma cylindrospora]|uniref:AAT-domain-containing protein n=1 Tax=Coleophoma cylindrospora TaxID=1849047 RepID=A0A3D8R681_9HELO|nr:AAT-domain-containing protein [Coleophoma cylindrospora]